MIDYGIRSPLGQLMNRLVAFATGKNKFVRTNADGSETTWEIRDKS